MNKPHLNYSIHIKNLHTYRDFLKKRPRRSQQFKFSIIRNRLGLTRTDEKQIQLKLLKVLKVLKTAPKVDLGACEIKDYDFWEANFLSAFKRISRTQTLCVEASKIDFEAKSLKCFGQLKNLLYQLTVNRSSSSASQGPLETQNYLRPLKYCPKISSLNFTAFLYNYISPKTCIISNRSLRSLESLTFRLQGWSYDQLEFPIGFCKKLKSISFQFPDLNRWESLALIMEALSKLPDLQEIYLSQINNLMFDFLKTFTEITNKGMLKKVKLEFGSSEGIPQEEIFKALKACKLTHFSFSSPIKKGLLKSLSVFLKSMDHLETLDLHILNSNLFPKHKNFVEMCKQISKLQALRSLKLNFHTLKKVYKDTRISNFIPHLSDAFKKPIKIETFQIQCNQLDPSETLQTLMSLFGNSAAFLTHLKINFDAISCAKKTYYSILKLMRNLSSIQVLEIPFLGVNESASQYLNQIAEAVHECKYLRVFEIGEIKDTVPLSAFKKTVETITVKRGLRQFRCLMHRGLIPSCLGEKNALSELTRRILEKNPSLETLSTGTFSCFNLDLNQGWTEF